MSKKNKNSPTVLKKNAMILAAITFALGFFAGVGFTVFKANSMSGTVSTKGQDIDLAQRAKMLEAKLENNPDNAAAWIQLGHVYFDTDQYAKAINAYKNALNLNPNNADVLTDLGIMYRRIRRPRQAIEKFDQAIAVDPKHETARLNKGIVLMHDLKDRERAIQSWEKLLEINPLAMASNEQSVDQLVKHYKDGHDKKTSK